MATAWLEVTGEYSKRSFVLHLDFNHFSANTWWCRPGYLGATEGTWTSSGLTDSIYVYDPDDELVARSFDMDVDYLGYPFSGLAGDTGPISVYAKGSVLYQDVCTWKFLFV
jgi:hypothetical protein